MVMEFTTPDEGFAWMESLSNMERSSRDKKRAFRLERMRELCRHFGDPQESCPVVHIAGTKGKGSTAAFLAYIQAEAGHKTGLYTSPHLTDYRERIQIITAAEGARPVPEEILTGLMNRIRSELDRKELDGGYPTTFELLTLLGFLSFRESGCSRVVLETGLGGRLDATNVCRPELTLITPIEKEHTEFLGNTLEEIAGEKGGIIKPGVPLLTARQKPEVLTVLKRIAGERGSSLTGLEDCLQSRKVTYNDRGSMDVLYRWEGDISPIREISLSMVGAIQADNAALALMAVPYLSAAPSEVSVKHGLSRAHLPGRSHVLSRNPLIMLDGAHTPRSVEAILEAFTGAASEASERVLIFGCALDKDARAMAAVLAPPFDRIIISRPGTFKKSDPPGVAGIFSEYALCELIEDPVEAVKTALAELSPGGALLVTGSFYLAGEIYHALS
ncbi:MAG: bifunctional folylpolyglutamate synthase/dihydrofolate synthase [Spirochaetales bacterium]|nr:bifunctional folylpolyglutamate synthase/dihydrofolate synthase [Spirochaetales bacterium]